MRNNRYDEMSPAEARAEWVKDLRSGKYSQATGCLHKPGDGYCCLGVACETFKRCGGQLQVEIQAGDRVTYDGCGALLPPVVGRWLGLQDICGDAEGFTGDAILDGEATTLAVLNDDGMPFARIAELIEQDMLITC